MPVGGAFDSQHPLTPVNSGDNPLHDTRDVSLGRYSLWNLGRVHVLGRSIFHAFPTAQLPRKCGLVEGPDSKTAFTSSRIVG